MLLDPSDELLRSCLHADVDDLEARTLEHDVDEVLADVVDVALDRAHEEGADGLGAGLSKERAQHVECAAHGLTSDEHLRHEEVAALETGADLFKRRDERVEQDLRRRESICEALVGELENAGGVAHHGLVVQALEDLVVGHAAPAFRGVGRDGVPWDVDAESAVHSWTMRAPT